MKRKIVTLGASAGGLAALEAFFKSVPDDPDCSFVLIQHLSPDFKSLMSQLLAAYTRLPIQEVESGLKIEQNHIYLIPAGHLMTIHHGRFELHPRNAEQMPINTFMESVAKDFGADAVAVILSGTGTDGTLGARAIRNAGGLVISQEPSSAEFPSMPESIIRNLYNHHTGRPQSIWPIIAQYEGDVEALSKTIGASGLLGISEKDSSLGYSDLFHLLKRLYQIDFSNYKIASVNRRIERRMNLIEKPRIAEYLDHIIANRDESDALFRDLLIGVTEFMRDPSAFQELADRVIRPVLAGEDPPPDYRIWIAGCASGEEAYSLAILSDEVARECNYSGSISIFATDLHKSSIQRSGKGIYTQAEVVNLSPERLNRYFKVTETGDFKIKPEIRQRVVFAQHNLLVDPPFTKMDLVTCRNLLIYLKPESQDSVVRSLHYALKMGGTLFLGSSESLGEKAQAFKTISSRNKIFRKHADAKGQARPSQLFTRPNLRGIRNQVSTPPAPSTATTTIDRNLLQAYDLVLKRYAPSGVLVDRNREVRHFFGNVSHYFSAPEGRADSDVLSMFSGDLKLAISTTLQRVLAGKDSPHSEGLSCTTRHGEEVIDISITPYFEEDRDLGLILITFEARNEEPKGGTIQKHVSFKIDDETHSRILTLEDELRSTKQNLKSTVEELQTSNEELQAINEEVQVSNEELQSTNEELHSMNEELYTVNAELEQKNLQLIELNEDHENLLANTEDGVLYIDTNLRIKKFNPAIGFAFNLLPQDIGRPIEHIAYNLEEQHDMIEEVKQVLASGMRLERETISKTGTTYLRRFTPFVDSAGDISGVVLTFTDITEVSQMRSRLSRAMESAQMAWWEWDVPSDRLNVHAEGACILGYDCDAIDRTSGFWFDRVHPDDLEEVKCTLHACLDGKTGGWDCEHRYAVANTDPVSWEWVHEVGRVTRRTGMGEPLEMAGTTMNIHRRKLLEIELRTSKEKAERALLQKNQFVPSMSREIRTPLNGIRGVTDLLALEVQEPALRQHLEVLTQSTEALLNLIDLHLDHEDIQSGRIGFDYSICDLVELVDSVLDALSKGQPSKCSDTETDFNLRGTLYEVDPIRLRLVLNNIIAKAVGLSDDAARVRVQVADTPEVAGFLRFTVSTLNSCVSKSVVDHTPQSPSRADDAPVRQPGSLDLGLLVSKEVIKLMGGEVEIESKESAGVTVSFSIRAKRAQGGDAMSPRVGLPAFGEMPESKPADAKPLVLIVDDDPSNRIVLKKMLQKMGFEVASVSTMDEAMGILDGRSDFNLAILDLNLPEGSGFELVDYIRRDLPENPYKELPVYACTADVSAETRTQVKASRFDGMLVKPLRIAPLNEALNRHLPENSTSP